MSPRFRRDSHRSSVSESVVDVYGGPEEFMEAGTRGFLVTTLSGKEEFAVDDAIELLRQAAVKLYGGIKPKSKKNMIKLGYVKIDFMDPEQVVEIPPPEGEEEEVEEVTEKENTEETKGEKMETDEKKEETTKDEANVETAKKESSKDGSTEGENKEDADKTEGENDGEKKKEEPKIELQYRRSMYKFKAFRTEIRNVMFVKSNVPDPMKVAETVMEIVIERKSIMGDSLIQLLPVLGVCPYDYQQLEIMTRRVLAPIFDETLEPKGFTVLLVDKMSEPGAELLTETVRNTIWSMNPLAYLSSALTEPEAVIRVELIGSKVVLGCLTNFMKYRQYCPKLLVQIGAGEPEDDDGTWISGEERKRREIWRKSQETMRELERQKQEERRKREEERRKEREKRKAEAEARRQDRQKEKDDRKRDKDGDKKSDEKSKGADEGKKSSSKSKGTRDDKKSGKEKDIKQEEIKMETEIKTEVEVKEEIEESSEAQQAAEDGAKAAKTEESPPKKRARVESSDADVEAENEDNVEESEEGEDGGKGKKGSPRGRAKAKRGGRRKR